MALLSALMGGVGLSGCASMSEQLAERMGQAPAIGLPADAPERPAVQHAYPAVHEMPPPRQAATLNALELHQMENELVSARDRQQAAVGPVRAAPTRAAPARPTKVRRTAPPPRVPAATPAAVSASSGQSIY